MILKENDKYHKIESIKTYNYLTQQLRQTSGSHSRLAAKHGHCRLLHWLFAQWHPRNLFLQLFEHLYINVHYEFMIIFVPLIFITSNSKYRQKDLSTAFFFQLKFERSVYLPTVLLTTGSVLKTGAVFSTHEFACTRSILFAWVISITNSFPAWWMTVGLWRIFQSSCSSPFTK